jgi:hypothetical protein
MKMAVYRPRRPRDAPGGRLRRLRVGVNLSSIEYDVIEEFAREHGLSIGAAVRQLTIVSALHERNRIVDAPAAAR